MIRTRLTLALFALLTFAAPAAFATSSDIVLTTPAVGPTVTKVCVAKVIFDVENTTVFSKYRRCTSPGNYVGTEATYLTVTPIGWTAVDVFGVQTTGTNVTWATAQSDFSSLPAALKTFTTRVLPGS